MQMELQPTRSALQAQSKPSAKAERFTGSVNFSRSFFCTKPILRYFPGEAPLPYFPCDHSRFHFFSAAGTMFLQEDLWIRKEACFYHLRRLRVRCSPAAQTALASSEKMKARKHGLICKASRVEDLRLNSVKTWKHMVLTYIEINELSVIT